MTSAAFVAALKTQLEARFAGNPTFAPVAVHLYQADATAPAVVLVRSRIVEEVDYSYAAMGPLADSAVTIPGLVGTRGPLQAAADQAQAILNEIRAELDTNPPTVGGRTVAARLDRVAWMPFPADGGDVIVDAEFDVTYNSH